MELTEREQDQIKWIYDAYYGGRINADEALNKLELLLNDQAE
jgi:hypothetical protein